MQLLMGIWKEAQRWNQLLLLAQTTVAWMTLIETGSEQEGASPFPLQLSTSILCSLLTELGTNCGLRGPTQSHKQIIG